jgi:hypothetical protein
MSGAVITIDRPAFELAGVEGAPVTLHRRNAPLGHVLESLAEQASTDACRVTFTDDGDAIIVTTAEALERRQPVVRVYDVRDMTAPSTTDPSSVARRPAGVPPAAADDLESLVRESVAPDSWRDAGGRVGQVRHVAGRLVVTQTADNHRQVERLLQALRESTPPPEPPRPAPDVLVWHEGLREWTPLSSGPAEAALARRVAAVTLDDVPLEQAIEVLRQQWAVPVYVKWKDLDREGFDRRAGVSAVLRDVTLAEALDAVLADHRGAGGGRRLSYAVEKGLVTVLTEAVDAPALVTRVYDLRDWPPLRDVPPVNNTGPWPMTPAQMQAWLRAQVIDDLSGVITESVAPATWRDAGGELGAMKELHGSLIVTQTVPNQERVRRLLNALRVTSATRPAAHPTTAPRPSSQGVKP